jgi:hypothetical protein
MQMSLARTRADDLAEGQIVGHAGVRRENASPRADCPLLATFAGEGENRFGNERGIPIRHGTKVLRGVEGYEGLNLSIVASGVTASNHAAAVRPACGPGQSGCKLLIAGVQRFHRCARAINSLHPRSACGLSTARVTQVHA